MRILIAAAAACLLATSAIAGEAHQSKSENNPAASTKEKALESMEGTELAEDTCTGLWLELNVSGAPGLTEVETQGHVKNFKKANPDGDSTIDQKEWMHACKVGLVTKTSAKTK